MMCWCVVVRLPGRGGKDSVGLVEVERGEVLVFPETLRSRRGRTRHTFGSLLILMTWADCVLCLHFL